MASKRSSLTAILSIAYKELLHVVRDKRILTLIILLPPFFTFMFGHAFEVTDIEDAPAVLVDKDKSSESEKLIAKLKDLKTFQWREGEVMGDPDKPRLFETEVAAVITIPEGWGKGTVDGDPKPIHLAADGTDTTTAQALEGVLRETLGKYQIDAQTEIVDNLPDEVIDLGKEIPEATRKQFVSIMSPWDVETKIYYNPGLRFIDFVVPGIIGLILQLLTVTLMACTIARERETGTLAQLLVTPLRQWEVVIGKVLPYLGISLVLIAMTIAVAKFHFGVHFRQPAVLGLICFLFLLSSLGLGLMISAFCQSQTQAIQFAVFFLLPVFPLSGAFAPLQQLPNGIRAVSEIFPLTHFCRAFRAINLADASIMFIMQDLIALILGALITCFAAAWLLKHSHD